MKGAQKKRSDLRPPHMTAKLCNMLTNHYLERGVKHYPFPVIGGHPDQHHITTGDVMKAQDAIISEQQRMLDKAELGLRMIAIQDKKDEMTEGQLGDACFVTANHRCIERARQAITELREESEAS